MMLHPDTATVLRLGAWAITKYREQAARVGVQQAARNMRKQGMPLELALATLSRRA